MLLLCITASLDSCFRGMLVFIVDGKSHLMLRSLLNVSLLEMTNGF